MYCYSDDTKSFLTKFKIKTCPSMANFELKFGNNNSVRRSDRISNQAFSNKFHSTLGNVLEINYGTKITKGTQITNSTTY